MFGMTHKIPANAINVGDQVDLLGIRYEVVAIADYKDDSLTIFASDVDDKFGPFVAEMRLHQDTTVTVKKFNK